ncbi:EIN3-binding F-box protein 1-like [Salvia miltiorrhiza]|uniref:EIN3-binding F-box protein 1-like n=1 Tax=Salvia miltiorrhiza TaxID=226208 RepID=UPI0025AB771F|nr:EIN3-binding F-box protein 1-like [Salvia miltiorrhiza]
MSEVFDFSDVGAFRPGFLPNPKDSSLFLSPASLVDLYVLPRKRSRVCAPFVVSQEAKPKPSIEVLPDECLFEVFRRLPGGKQRSACACVSKRWLMLLSSITRDEICAPQVAQSAQLETQSKPQESDGSFEVKGKCEFDGVDGIRSDEEKSNGFLSRCLEGKKATDVRLASIAVGTASRGGLGKLSIRGSASTRGLTDLGLKAISRGSPSLRTVSLWNLSSISDEGLSDLANGCRSIEKIDFCNCPAITDKGLTAIAMNCPNLMSVTVESCSNIGNESLQALGRFCPNLKCVTIKNCPLVGDQGIAGLFTSAGHILTKAKLESLNITDVSLAVIGHYGREMTDISLTDLQNVNERGFWVMGKGQGLQKVRSLSITSCPGASDLGLEAVSQGCPNLKMFALRKCLRVSDNGVVSFAKGAADSLESLQIEECHVITQRGFFGILANCGEKLKALAVANCLGIRDLNFGFPLTSCCDSLRSLTIRNCPGFGDSSLSLLGRICRKLTHVDLSGLESITDAGIVPLVQSSEAGLVKVNLSKCVNLSDSSVSAIAKIHGETLELLNLDGCRRITDTSLVEIARNCLSLGELDVSHSGITDYGVTALAAAEQMNLQIFSVVGCSLISDKSLPCLLALGKTLVGLNIQRCRGISFGATSILLDQLWRCDILY